MDPFDFSNQYANIAYYKLKSVIGELINFSFNSVDKNSLRLVDMVLFGLIDYLLIKKI